jgi:hypothetical protein
MRKVCMKSVLATRAIRAWRGCSKSVLATCAIRPVHPPSVQFVRTKSVLATRATRPGPLSAPPPHAGSPPPTGSPAGRSPRHGLARGLQDRPSRRSRPCPAGQQPGRELSGTGYRLLGILRTENLSSLHGLSARAFEAPSCRLETARSGADTDPSDWQPARRQSRAASSIARGRGSSGC